MRAHDDGGERDTMSEEDLLAKAHEVQPNWIERHATGSRLLGGVVLAAIVAAAVHAVALAQLTQAEVEETLERQEGLRTAEWVLAQLLEHLGPDPLARLAVPETRNQAGKDIVTVLAPWEIIRVKVFGPDGTILWSDESALIGRRFENPRLDRALRGEVVSEIEPTTDPEHEFERSAHSMVAEVYTPVYLQDRRLSGVVEVYRSADDVAAAVSRVRAIIWGGAAAATTVLCLTLSLIVITSQRRLFDLQTALRGRSVELASEKEKLEHIVDGLGVGLALVDSSCRIRWGNRLLMTLRNSENTLEGDDPFPFCVPGSPACLECPACKARETQKETRSERVWRDAAGDERRSQVTVWPMSPVESSRGMALVLVQDVTEVWRLQEQVRHADKLAALGRLASGVAHEVGNPVSSMSALLQVIARKEIAEVKPQVDLLFEQIDRIGKVVRSISGFSRRPTADRRPFDINDALTDALRMARMDRRWRDYTVLQDLWTTPLVIDGNAGQVVQVFVNLLLNAADAMQPGGTVRIRTAFVGGRVEAIVANSGPGIPAAARARVFEPFYTTKDPGQGTGLGLYLAWNTMVEHGGSIRVIDEPGWGASFRMEFPTLGVRTPDLPQPAVVG